MYDVYLNIFNWNHIMYQPQDYTERTKRGKFWEGYGEKEMWPAAPLQAKSLGGYYLTLYGYIHA